MPILPHVVSGTIIDSRKNKLENAFIVFTSAAASKRATTNRLGQYTFDLANISYISGETISYISRDEFMNEVVTGTFIVSGGTTSLSVTLSERPDAECVSSNHSSQLFNIGGKIVSKDNPLPVSIIDSSDLFDLINNAAHTWTITRSDGQPDSETIEIGGRTYKRTFTYNASNIMTARSKWVRQ